MWKLLWLIPALLAIAYLEGVLTRKKGERNEKDVDYGNFMKKKNVLTKSEREYLAFLESIIDEKKYRILANVRLADIVSVKKGKQYRRHLNMIIQKHVDFVITKRKDSSTVLVIELDGDSHDRFSAKKNDEFKNELFRNIGVSFLRMKRKARYSDTDAIQLNSKL